MSATMPGDLRRRAWRWHFLAAVLVVPFVLWQSVTGTIYLWSQAWTDAQHPGLRFVAPGETRVPLDVQLARARINAEGRLTGIVVPADPARSTQFAFAVGDAPPTVVFVDPYRGAVLGRLAPHEWPAGWSRKLHGGWPLGSAGSWLLELGACWTLVMVLTGVYLWWPRDGRGWRALLPRLGVGRRLFWRDLHACVAVWIALALAVFLVTAMPWTSFWGGQVLKPVQRALGQDTPAAMGFAPVFLPAADAPRVAQPLEAMRRAAHANGVHGDLMFAMVDGPPGSAVAVRSLQHHGEHAGAALFDRASAVPLARASSADLPAIPRAVATGVAIHEGRAFGRFGPWVNTAFAAVLAWLAVSGVMAWWSRRPAHGIGVPPRPRAPWPGGLRVAGAALCIVFPLLGASALALWLGERAWAMAGASRRAGASA